MGATPWRFESSLRHSFAEGELVNADQYSSLDVGRLLRADCLYPLITSTRIPKEALRGACLRLLPRFFARMAEGARALFLFLKEKQNRLRLTGRFALRVARLLFAVLYG